MRILNDEEIPSDFLLGGATPRESYKMGNKAQFNLCIKDIIEWGNSGCEHGGCLPSGHYEFRKNQCSKCWQEFLKQLVEG